MVARDGGSKVERKKALWEEATSPSNLVPGGIEGLVPAEYVAFFAGPELSRNQGAIELVARRLSKVPAHVPKEEHKARTVLLAQLNNTIGAEALALRLGVESPAGASARALVKGNLLSLWQAFHSFAMRKLAFRKRALKGCFSENVLYQHLISSNPFTLGLFDPQVVQEIMGQAAQQAKGVLQVLGFTSSKRPADAPVQPRPKRARLSGPSRQQDQSQPGPSKQSSQQDKPRAQGKGQTSFKPKRSSGNRRR